MSQNDPNPFDQFDQKVTHGNPNDFDQFDAPVAAAPAAPTGFIDAAARGFKRSLPETKSLLYGATAAAGGLVGADGVRDWGLENYRRVQREEVEPLASTSSFKGSVTGDESLGEWAGDTLGNFGGQALQSLAVAAAGAAAGGAAGAPAAGVGAAPGAVIGAVGGLVARGGAKKLIQKEVGELVAEQVARGVGKDIAEKAGQQLATRRLAQLGGGALAGTGLNVGQEVGIGYTGRADDAAEAGETLTQGDALRAVAWGIPAGLVDTAAEGVMAGRLFAGASKSPSMVRRTLAGAAQGAVTEGGTEGVQAVMERAGAGQELAGSEAYDDYLENVAAGALGGSVPGAASGIRRSLPPNAPRPEDTEVLALPPPEAVTITPDGTAVTASQAYERQRADAAFTAEREAAGLTPDVNAARATHPGAVPNGPVDAYSPAAELPALPAPGGLDSTVDVDEFGNAELPGQALDAATAERNLADAQAVHRRNLLGLTPDVNAARARHPGAMPNGPAEAYAAARSLPALPAPGGLDSVIDVDSQGNAALPGQALDAAESDRNLVDALTVQRRNQLGLTPDVNTARARHPGATPNTLPPLTLPDGSPVPSPTAGALSRAVNIGVDNGAVQAAAQAEAIIQAAEASVNPKTAAPIAATESAQQTNLFDMDPATGEVIPSANQAADDLRTKLAYLREQAKRGGWSQRLVEERRSTERELKALTAAETMAARPKNAARIPIAAEVAQPASPAQPVQLESAGFEAGVETALPVAAAQVSEPAQAPVSAVDVAAADAAISPMNDRAAPTDAQKEAGNYKKGHVRVSGLDIAIENPAGTSRRPEWPPLQNHYGYIKRSMGADKDHVDVFLTDRAEDESLPVFVVDQVNKDGSFDEHKVVMGAGDEASARATYLGNYAPGWDGLGGITQMTQDEFKAWVKDPEKTTQPAATPEPESQPHGDALTPDAARLAAAEYLRALEGGEVRPGIRNGYTFEAGDGAVRVKPGHIKVDGQDRLQFRISELQAEAKSAKTAGQPPTAGNEGLGAQPTNPVHDALRSIAGGNHPERSLEGLSPSDVRAVGEAMGRRFSPKASHVAIAERIGEMARSDWMAAAQRAVDKLLISEPPAGREVAKPAKAVKSAKPAAGTAPEHSAEHDDLAGIGSAEMRQMVKAFEEAGALSSDEGVTHVFDPPAKSEVVRLQEKVKVFNKDHGWMSVEQAKDRIAEWKANVRNQGADDAARSANSQRVVLSLFDLTGSWSKPWEEAGYQVYRFDIQDDPVVGDVTNFSTDFFGDWFGDFDGNDIYAILAACPCTDFAVSGARHFAAKDADGRTIKSIRLVRQTLAAIERFKPSIWALENPVGRIEKLAGLQPWRLSFDPNHLGDTYTKKTLIWGRFNADLPIAPVEPTEGSKMHKLYGGKSLATKNARSATPEGFAYGFFAANNAIDNPVLAVANKYDRLDRTKVAAAVERGITAQQFSDSLDDHYYMDMDDAAGNAVLDYLAANGWPAQADEMRGHEFWEQFAGGEQVDPPTPEPPQPPQPSKAKSVSEALHSVAAGAVAPAEVHTARVRTVKGQLQYDTSDMATLGAYFQPERIVQSYGGQDRVIAFKPATGSDGWSVNVQAVDSDGIPVPDESPRWHSTLPGMKDLVAVLGPPVKPARKAAPAPTPPSKPSLLDQHSDVLDRARSGTATPAQFKEAFAAMTEGNGALVAELSAMTKDRLLGAGGGFFASRYKNDRKDVVVAALAERVLSDFSLGRSYGPSSYMMTASGLEQHRAAKETALRELVANTTEADLKKFADEVAIARAEVAGARESSAKALADPQSLADFNAVMRKHMGEGSSFQDAYLLLTPGQRVRYDELAAESTRSQRDAAKAKARTAVATAGQATTGQVIETKHTKHGHDLFVVQLGERVSREDYDTLNASARRMGGNYSSYRGNGAVPGFQFRSRESAEAFTKLVAGDAGDARAVAEARRDAFEDDRSQGAADRLRTMADRLAERAEESLGRDRKQNTARRARMAAGAEASARADQALGGTMRNLAAAIDSGEVKFLDSVRQKVQVEFLAAELRNAKDAQIRAKYPTYGEQEKHKGAPADAETVDFATFPSYTAMRSDLAGIARQMLEVDGLKKLGARLLSAADDVSEAYTTWAKDNLRSISRFGRADELAEFRNQADAERGIRRSGLADRAIVLQIKRGQNRVVLSPSEAMKQGLWEGDGDKRITLNSEFGKELVGAIGRRAGQRIRLPWGLEGSHAKRQRLEGMGILTAAEYRSALREFAELQEAIATPNKIKEMERAMVGRRNDGLDFFPTSDEVVDTMLAAAEIEPGMSVLEPSAGMGHIADAIRDKAAIDADVVELSGDRRELLEAKGYHLVGDDFLAISRRDGYTYGDVFRDKDGSLGVMRGSGGMGSGRVGFQPLLADGKPDERGARWVDREDLEGVQHRGTDSGYDRIVMNPPFSKGRDIEHVRHAYDLLRPGGRLVAIMGEGAFFQSNKNAESFRTWLDDLGATSEKLPDGSFMDPALPVNTGVSARMVVIDKPAGEGVKFSRPDAAQTNGRAASGLAATEVRKAVEAVTAGWRGDAPVVHVVQRADELPARATADPDHVGVEGFYDDVTGRVYLVADNLSSVQRAHEVLAHEAVGHYGIEAITGPALWQELSGTIGKMRAAGKHAELFAEIDRRYRGANADIALRETVAVMAEKGVRNSVVDKAIAAVRRFLRSLGFDMGFSEAELRQHLVAAARYVRGGSRPRQAPLSLAPAGGELWSKADRKHNMLTQEQIDLLRGLGIVSPEQEADLGGQARDDDGSGERNRWNEQLTSDADERSFLSSFPAGQSFTTRPDDSTDGSRTSRLLGRVRRESEAASDQLAGNPATPRTLKSHAVGPFSGVSIEARIKNAGAFNETLEVLVFGREQLAAKLDEEPALTFSVTGSGELVVNGPNPDGRTFREFQKKGWAEHALDADGQVASGWSRLVGRDGSAVLSNGQILPLLADVHARVRAWNGKDRVGLHWQRATGATGGALGRETAAFFSKKDPQAVVDAVDARARGIDEGMAARLKDTFRGLKPENLRENTRPAWLGALTLRHLAELGGDIKLGQVAAYADRVQRMATDRNVMQEAASDTADAWEKFQRKDRAGADTTANLMHDTTIEGVDPSKDYQPLRTGATKRGPDEVVTRESIERRLKAVAGDMEKARSSEAVGRLEAESKRLQELLQQEKRRREQYPELVRRYLALPESGRKIYQEVRDAYEKQSDQMEEALVARIEALQGDGKAKASMVSQVRQQFEDARLNGPYFPLQRFGEFWISAENAAGETSFTMYERVESWREAQRDLAAQGFKIKNAGRKLDEARNLAGASGGFMADLQGLLETSGVDSKTRDEVYQLYLRTLPDLSVRKHQIHRKATAGYSNDALRAFSSNMFHGSFQVARLRHSHELDAELLDMKAAVNSLTESDPETAAKAAALYTEMNKRHEWVMNPKDSKGVSSLTSLGFAWYLGSTPAAAIVNLSQTAIVTFPVLAARHGVGKAFTMLSNSMGLAIKSSTGDITRHVTDEERSAFKLWRESGTIDKTQAHNLAGLSETDTRAFNPWVRRGMEVISWMFHKTETMNREASALAAFRLARQAGQSFNEAVQYASDVVTESHFDYSNANRSRFMQSNAAKVLLLFRQYSLNMTWFLWRNLYQSIKGQAPEVRKEARTKLAGILGMTGVFAGVMGMPLMSVMFGLANAAAAAFGDDDDEPFDAEVEFRNFLADMLGTDVARIIAKGPTDYVTGANVSGRVSLNDLWLREPNRELEGQAMADYLLEQAAGPLFGGMLVNTLRGMKMVGDGHTWRGVETMMPKALKDGMKSLRYTTQGVNTLKGDPVIEDLGVGGSLLQLAGFSPASLGERYEGINASKNFEEKLLNRRSSLLNAYAMAWRAGDAETVSRVNEKIRSFNAAQPALAIDSSTIRNSLKARMRYSSRAEGGVVLNPKIAERAREQGRFAE